MTTALTKLNKLMISTLNVVLSIVVGFLVLVVVWGVFTRYVLGDSGVLDERAGRFFVGLGHASGRRRSIRNQRASGGRLLCWKASS